MKNFALAGDSYKMSHSAQYRDGTTGVNSYIEARKGEDIVFFGMQAYIHEYLLDKVKSLNAYTARAFCADHGVPFNEDGWLHLMTRIQCGYGLPVEIYSVDEGTVMPSGNVQVQIRNTMPEFFWLTSWLETQVLRGIWYPSTIASNSRKFKMIIKDAMEKSCDTLDGLPFMLQDFGARGASSGETAAIGGAAHLVNFYGSDTMEGVSYVIDHYAPSDMPGYSVPASEHSTMTSWGRDGEVDACSNMLQKYGDEGAIISVVSDSYDIFNCVENIWGGWLKHDVELLGTIGGRLVVRPDSGDLIETPIRVCEILMEKFGYSTNSKGFKVLPDYLRVLQGDGLNGETLQQLCNAIVDRGLSMDNFVFGMGGGLLQNANRDTYGYAMKTSATLVDGHWEDTYKDPVSGGKTSKKGILALYKNEKGEYVTCREADLGGHENLLKLRYKDGVVHNETTFDAIRHRAQ